MNTADYLAALARAWEEGHLAGDRDGAVARAVEAGVPVNVPFPTSNPYSGPHPNYTLGVDQCADHRLRQHRDHRPPWCDACGRTAEGELIGTPPLKISSCSHPADMRLPRDMCGICHEKLLPETDLRPFIDQKDADVAELGKRSRSELVELFNESLRRG